MCPGGSRSGWRHLLDHRGFAGFAAEAAEQFLHWESHYGWTRTGWGKISHQERRLADVIAGLLTVPDTWVTFTEHYLQVLDGLAPPPASTRGQGRPHRAGARRRELDHRVVRRAETMIDWHLVLLDRFAGTEDEVLLDRLAGHASLGGVEQTYLQARLARVRGDLPLARRLIHQALEQLPGHSGFLALARETDVSLPAEAGGVSASTSAATGLSAQNAAMGTQGGPPAG